MQPIVVIAPENTSYETVQRVALDLGIQDKVRLHLTGLSRSLEYARQAEREGAHVIVARGWSANQIVEAGIRTPVVFLPVSMQDFVFIIERAVRKSGLEKPRIGFLTYPLLQRELEAMARMLHIPLKVYPTQGVYSEMRKTVRAAKDDGMDIIVGGETVAGIAERVGIACQILVCGEASIRQALCDAERVVYARELEQTQTLKFRTVLEHSHDGVVSLDAEGRVLLVNAVARRMLRLKNDITGFPFSDVLELAYIERCLHLGQRVVDEMVEVEERQLLFSAIPIRVGDLVMGAVLTFQEPRAIAAKESKIRHNTQYSGMVAQYSFRDIQGCSRALLDAVGRARQFASSRQAVLIYGETGTGKELFAQAMHNASPVKDGPFVAINCGALPQALLESELFGYEEGAFTGASRKGKPGLFELADKGTLFLDEIAELDPHAQRRLLRVFEAQSIMRLSGTRQIPVDVRIIAATNANLWERVQNGEFRADLFYRLSVLLLQLPPLRVREGDLPLLARHFFAPDSEMQGEGPLSPTALRVMLEHDWPGNVRELRYFIQRLRVTRPDMDDAAAIRAELMPLQEAWERERTDAPAPALALNLHTPGFEKERILRALEACQGHQGKTARMLEMDRSTLFRKMRKLGIR